MNATKTTSRATNRTQLRINTARIGCAGHIRPLRQNARLSAEQRQLIIALMLEREGLAGACAKANIGLALVLAERRRNPAFRRALAAAEKQRLALLEMLLTDIVVRGLLASEESPNSDAREKFLSGLAQALLEKSATRKEIDKPEKAAAGKSRKTAPGQSRSADTHTALDHDALSALLAETERRIAEAEAELEQNGAVASD